MVGKEHNRWYEPSETPNRVIVGNDLSKVIAERQSLVVQVVVVRGVPGGPHVMKGGELNVVGKSQGEMAMIRQHGWKDDITDCAISGGFAFSVNFCWPVAFDCRIR